MTLAPDRYGMDYVDADIPAGITIRDWRAQRAARAIVGRQRRRALRQALRRFADRRRTLRGGHSQGKTAT